MFLRVFRIAYSNEAGTAFAIDVDSRQYLVTAKHVVSGIKDGHEIGIYNNTNWVQLPVRVIDIADTNIDITVLILSGILSNAGSAETTTIGVHLGKEVYFFGFPFFVHSGGNELTRDFPIACVKRAIVSAFQPNALWLDGMNNPGFSGGPVAYQDSPSKRPRIIGVVSGYLSVAEAVRYRGKPNSDLQSFSNTGLIKCYPIDSAIDAIKRRPEGPKLN